MTIFTRRNSDDRHIFDFEYVLRYTYTWWQRKTSKKVS